MRHENLVLSIEGYYRECSEAFAGMRTVLVYTGSFSDVPEVADYRIDYYLDGDSCEVGDCICDDFIVTKVVSCEHAPDYFARNFD